MINLESIFEKVKYNALDYIGLYQAPVSSLSSILSSVVEKNSTEVLFDANALTEAMRSAGAEETEIYQVCIMTQVPGLREVLDRDPRTAQLDLDRYMQNAIAQTGLNRDTILRITAAISYANGSAMHYQTSPKKDIDLMTDNIANLAHTVCQEQLAKFQDAFESVVYKDSNTTELDFEMIEPLARYGLPKAKYYLGYCLLNGVQLVADEAQGVQLLQEAADAGDSQAAATLGDYYFAKCGSDNWTKAYDYYTGYGSLALNNNRKNAIVSILNHKKFNKTMLGLCIAFFLAFLATVIWCPGAGIFASRALWGWLAVVIQLALLVLKIMHYRAKPYDCLYTLPVAMSAVWFVYMAIRLLF